MCWADMAAERDAGRNSIVSLFLKSLKKAEKYTKRQDKQKEGSNRLKYYTEYYFHLWTLFTALSFPHSTR